MITPIIQCRYGSTRLPGKALEKIGKKTMLAHCVDSARKIKGVQEPIVATGSESTNALVIDECRKIGVEWYSDYWLDENDVLQRFVRVGIKKATPYVLRLCADSPFYDVEYPNRAVKIVEEEPKYDYYAFYYNNERMPTVFKYPYGDLCEIISLRALVDAHLKPCTLSDREHVTPYIYKHEKVYMIRKIKIDALPTHKSCVDTLADLQAIRKWYKARAEK